MQSKNKVVVKSDTVEQKTDYFSKLPEAIILTIFSFLNAKEKGVASKVARNWNTLVNTDGLWKTHCIEEGIDAEENFKFAYINSVPKDRYFISHTECDSILGDKIVLKKDNILFRKFDDVVKLIQKIKASIPPYVETRDVIYAVKPSEKQIKKMKQVLGTLETGSENKKEIHTLKVQEKITLKIYEVFERLANGQFQKTTMNRELNNDQVEERRNSCTIS